MRLAAAASVIGASAIALAMLAGESAGDDERERRLSKDDRQIDSHARLWSHQKGGFYHDGRFPTLLAVIEHYERTFRLGLTSQEKAELVEYLKSL